MTHELHTGSDSAKLVRHVASAIANAAVFDDPAPYIVVTDILPRSVYEAVMSAYNKSTHLFSEQIHTGDPKIFFGSYGDRLQFKVPDALAQVDSDTALLWRDLFTALSSPEIASALQSKFNDGFVQHFGEDFDAAAGSKDWRPTMLVTKHRENYYLGPHTDRFEKIITCIINCPERDGLEHLGTAMYRPLEEDFTCRGLVHHNPELFELINIVPFKPNTATIFHRTDRLFHGVERITAQSSAGSERRNVQFNWWQR